MAADAPDIAMPARHVYKVLPNRRLAVIETLEWRPDVWAELSVGFDRAGRVREVFAALLRPTQWLDLSFADTARWLSHLLQEGGFDCDTMLPKLSAVEPEPDGMPRPSINRWLLEHALRLEASEGERIASVYRNFPAREGEER